MAATRSGMAAILTNIAVFVLTIVFSQLSTRVSDIFPRTQSEISGGNQTEITPAASTFAIWGFIYLYQAVWIIYTMTLLWRGDGDILPAWFYIAYSVGNISSVFWLIVWARGNTAGAFVILSLTGISLQMAMYGGANGLATYLEQFPSNEKLPNKIDVWCIRLLVLNGVLCYTAWVSIATCLNLCIVLQYDMSADGSKAATGVLFVLLMLIIVWFVVENFVFERFTRYLFIEYVVLIIGLSGILKKHWTDGKGNQSFVLAILVLSCLLFVARLVMIYHKEAKGANQGSNLRFVVRKTDFHSKETA